MNTVNLNSVNLVKSIPDRVKNHVGMISQQERQLLYTLARKYYKGNGIIIDGGAFLGGSTSALAYGLKDNKKIFFKKKKFKKVYSFERAIVAENFARHADKVGIESPGIGNSYEILLRQLISDFEYFVNLHVGDIHEYQGDDLEPIEICFLDILKEPEMSVHCMKLFLSMVIVDGYLIQQDYFFDGLPWIKVMTEALCPRKLEYLGEVRSSGVFKVTEKITQEDIVDIFSADEEKQIQLHGRAESRTVDPLRQYLMQISKARLYASFGRIEDASNIWKDADSKYSQYVFNEDHTYKKNIKWRTDSLEKYLNDLRSIRSR